MIGKACQPTGAAGQASLIARKQSRKHSSLEQRPADDEVEAVVYDLLGDRSRPRKPVRWRRSHKGIEKRVKGLQLFRTRSATLRRFVGLPELALIVGKHCNQRGLTTQFTRRGRHKGVASGENRMRPRSECNAWFG